ncbi:hypothetical protein DNTS_015181 [Danionella cerebrum]|uniref:Homeobox domain-containing protein n=1 Tax=Danionella cerebrum TaxID=2873325 RepID=A0A553MZL0_9TELE|nr:hypothetical protein DNTS_015181 [Danionella translucida]
MQMPARAFETYGQPVRPDYGTCAPKASAGKSFTIDALLARPEHGDRDRTSIYRNLSGQAPLQSSALPVLYSQVPHFAYNQGVMQTQSGYPVFCYPPFNFQTSCRGAVYSQDAALAKAAAHSHFKHKPGKSKRMRTSFTNEQLSRLEKEFARQQYMVGSERFLLASALQLTEAQVKVWFQNRRIKWRKQSLEQQQAKLAKLGLAVPPKSPGSQGREDEEQDFTDESDVEIDIDDSLQD